MMGAMERDAVDEVIAQWRRARPDLDPSPMGVIGRIARLAVATERELERVFGRYGLSGGEFDVLATLRRASGPDGVTPTELAESTMVTTGGMTKRLDALERRKLIRRDPREGDRRSVWISLTPKGHALVDDAVEAHVKNEERILSGLSKRDRDQLARLLRELALTVDTGRD